MRAKSIVPLAVALTGAPALAQDHGAAEDAAAPADAVDLLTEDELETLVAPVAL